MKIYTHRLSSFGCVALRDSPSASYKNTLLGLTTRAPARILEIRRVFLTVFCPLSLSACMGVYEGEFDCGVGQGVGCRSISQVNEMINRGQVPLLETEEEEKDDEEAELSSAVTLKTDHLPILEPLSSQPKVKVKRIPERTVRVWVAPHEAADGSFVEESYVNLVIEPGRWVNISSAGGD